MQDPFVSTEWLAERLDDPAVVILDGSWFLPTSRRNAYEDYLAGHIPRAVFFDIDEISDKSSDLPHMLPTPPVFAAAVGALGIGDGMTIVVYDQVGLFSAPRVWWEFVAMGAKDVRILAGGFPRWQAENRAVETGVATRPAATFTPDFNPGLVRSFDQMKRVIAAGQIADARPYTRFTGNEPEPRPGIRSGRMPGSINVPATSVVENGELRDVQKLRHLFYVAGLDLDRPVVTTCGSGITAATLLLALKVAGAEDVSLYDGSWAEWGAHPDAPVLS